MAVFARRTRVPDYGKGFRECRNQEALRAGGRLGLCGTQLDGRQAARDPRHWSRNRSGNRVRDRPRLLRRRLRAAFQLPARGCRWEPESAAASTSPPTSTSPSGATPSPTDCSVPPPSIGSATAPTTSLSMPGAIDPPGPYPSPEIQPLPREKRSRNNHPVRDPRVAPESGSINPNMGGSIRAATDKILDPVCPPNGQPSTAMRSVRQGLNPLCLRFSGGPTGNADTRVLGQPGA